MVENDLQLHEIAPTDLEEVARFISRSSGSGVPIAHAVERLSWILLENPARESGLPLGWCLRTPWGEIVACMCCATQKFCLGLNTFTLMMAHSFYVDDKHRGTGTSIFLKYLQLGRRYPLFVSSANATVAQMWQKLGGYPLGYSDHEVLGVLRWQPVLAESIYRKMNRDSLARATATLASPLLQTLRRLPKASPECEFVVLASPEQAASLCAGFPCDQLTSRRDTSFLRWRYFSRVDPTTRLFAFRPRDGEKQYLVGIKIQNRGYKQQIRALHVLDVWGEVSPEGCCAISACLAREYDGQIDMLVFRCLNQAQERALTARGFIARPFAAPVAWCIDKYRLLPTKDWYFVPADGDMSL